MWKEIMTYKLKGIESDQSRVSQFCWVSIYGTD